MGRVGRRRGCRLAQIPVGWALWSPLILILLSAEVLFFPLCSWLFPYLCPAIGPKFGTQGFLEFSFKLTVNRRLLGVANSEALYIVRIQLQLAFGIFLFLVVFPPQRLITGLAILQGSKGTDHLADTPLPSLLFLSPADFQKSSVRQHTSSLFSPESQNQSWPFISL